MCNFIWKTKRVIKKIFYKKINIVFVCHRPNVWGSLKTIFEACNNDKKFNVIIVAIPNKKQLPDLGLNHEIFESEGAEKFFKNYPCKVINGYNYATKKWLNLKTLKPDYVFFQQPYNICKPTQYNSSVVKKYAKLCYSHYGLLIFKGQVEQDVYPKDFFKDLSYIFSENQEQTAILKNIASQDANVILTGYARFDNLEKYKQIDSNIWNFNKAEGVKRIIWTPRWTTNENNCHFFDYKDKLIEYVEQNKDIDFIFRPHPQAFLEWNATGELPEKEANEYKKRYENCLNAKIDNQKEYLSTFYSSDILITDISSIIVDYYLTRKPIIYCHKTNHFNEFGSNMAKGFYWVHNWKELKNTLNMLKNGNDPYKKTREEVIQKYFYINPQGTGHTIKELIKKDFYGKN